MEEKIDNNTYHKKKLLIVIGIFLLILVGVTFAYFSTTDTFTNLFGASDYGADTTEVFTSPTGWMPGDTTPKTLTVTNSGSVCEHVRISYTEEWESKDGSTLPNSQDEQNAAIINLTNTNDWIKEGDYYYYVHDLQANQTTNSFMSSVTFNPLIENDYECTQTGNKRVCTSSEEGYDDATYTLTLRIDTVQCDASEDEWGVDVVRIGKKAYFDTGQNVSQKMKRLSGVSNATHLATNTTITAFKRSDNLPNDFSPSTANTISINGSDYPIYAWFDNTDSTIYWYSEAGTVYFYDRIDYLFYDCRNLVDISGLNGIKTDYVTNANHLFMQCLHLSDISPLANWNTKNITTISFSFDRMDSLTSIEALANWNVKKLEYMRQTFWHDDLLTSLAPLANWNTKSLSSIAACFSGCYGISSLSPLAGWNTSSMINMEMAFSSCYSITSLMPLSGWDVSKCRLMGEMFVGCSGLTSLQGVENWNVGEVTSMIRMFKGTHITTLSPLVNWDTSKVEDMTEMFSSTRLTDASGINDWDLGSVIFISDEEWSAVGGTHSGFYHMFYECSVHPTFTKRAGTWSSQNSFVPSS